MCSAGTGLFVTTTGPDLGQTLGDMPDAGRCPAGRGPEAGSGVTFFRQWPFPGPRWSFVGLIRLRRGSVQLRRGSGASRASDGRPRAPNLRPSRDTSGQNVADTDQRIAAFKLYRLALGKRHVRAECTLSGAWRGGGGWR